MTCEIFLLLAVVFASEMTTNSPPLPLDQFKTLHFYLWYNLIVDRHLLYAACIVPCMSLATAELIKIVTWTQTLVCNVLFQISNTCIFFFGDFYILFKPWNFAVAAQTVFNY